MKEFWKRRIRIQGKPDDVRAYGVTITDAETGKPIENVTYASIYLDPSDVCKAVLMYIDDETDENGQVVAKESFAEVENPEVDITAYEYSRENKA